MTETDRRLIRLLRLRIGEKKRELRNIATRAANGDFYVLRFVQSGLNEIRDYEKTIKQIENEDRNVLESFDDYTSWSHGSEDGDYVFAFVRDDRRHADHMRQKMKRAKKWQRKD